SACGQALAGRVLGRGLRQVRTLETVKAGSDRRHRGLDARTERLSRGLERRRARGGQAVRLGLGLLEGTMELGKRLDQGRGDLLAVGNLGRAGSLQVRHGLVRVGDDRRQEILKRLLSLSRI